MKENSYNDQFIKALSNDKLLFNELMKQFNNMAKEINNLKKENSDLSEENIRFSNTL